MFTFGILFYLTALNITKQKTLIFFFRIFFFIDNEMQKCNNVASWILKSCIFRFKAFIILNFLVCLFKMVNTCEYLSRPYLCCKYWVFFGCTNEHQTWAYCPTEDYYSGGYSWNRNTQSNPKEHCYYHPRCQQHRQKPTTPTSSNRPIPAPTPTPTQPITRRTIPTLQPNRTKLGCNVGQHLLD